MPSALEAWLLDSCLRRLFENPEKILSGLGVEAGMVVADIGCGPGFLTVPLAKLVGERGRVIAVDADDYMLRRLRSKAEMLGLQNIVTFRADAAELSAIPDSSVNLALIYYSLHHFGDKLGAVREAVRILKPSGRLVIVDWLKRFIGHGLSREDLSRVIEALSAMDLRIESRGVRVKIVAIKKNS